MAGGKVVRAWERMPRRPRRTTSCIFCEAHPEGWWHKGDWRHLPTRFGRRYLVACPSCCKLGAAPTVIELAAAAKLTVRRRRGKVS